MSVDHDFEHVTDPWGLLSKAENWHRLGFRNEAVIAADEAVDLQLKNAFDRLGVQKPANREEALRILGKRGMKLSNERLFRLKNIREKAERDEDDDITQSEIEMAMSIAEDSIYRISEQQESTGDRLLSLASHTKPSKEYASRFKPRARQDKNSSMLTVNSFNFMEPLSSRHKEVAPVETEFVTKLLLARAILNYKKKRIPHLVGLVVLVISIAPCSLFGIIGASGIILMLTGRSLFSVIGLAFDFIFIFIAYIFLRIVLYVRGATK